MTNTPTQDAHTLSEPIERAKKHLADCMEREDWPTHNCACNCGDVSELLAALAQAERERDEARATIDEMDVAAANLGQRMRDQAQELRVATQRASDLERRLEAALRLREGKYVQWSVAGGPNECEHGWAEGIPCPGCDKAALDALPMPERTA